MHAKFRVINECPHCGAKTAEEADGMCGYSIEERPCPMETNPALTFDEHLDELSEGYWSYERMAASEMQFAGVHPGIFKRKSQN